MPQQAACQQRSTGVDDDHRQPERDGRKCCKLLQSCDQVPRPRHALGVCACCRAAVSCQAHAADSLSGNRHRHHPVSNSAGDKRPPGAHTIPVVILPAIRLRPCWILLQARHELHAAPDMIDAALARELLNDTGKLQVD